MISLQKIVGTVTGFRFRRGRGAPAALVALLSGFGAVAFAVAPQSFDPADLPQRVVTETVEETGLAAQLEALAEQDLELQRTETTRSGDTVASVLRRAGVMAPAAEVQLAQDEAVSRALNGAAGHQVQVRFDSRRGEPSEIVVRYPAEDPAQLHSHFSRLTARLVDGRWDSHVETVALAVETRLASATIRRSLAEAAEAARLPESVAAQLAEMSTSELSAPRALRRGDAFNVIYQEPKADGEPVRWSPGAGRVLAAEFVGPGLSDQLIWFEGPQGGGSYFDGKGHSRQPSFLASPLAEARVTSGFAPRMDPIQHRLQDHQGVDYGAPVGTPVLSVADGVVDFAGQQRGYGNVVEIRHSGNRSTLYAHLSVIGVEKDQKVAKGDVLGAVGATGWATGPHLHFEFRVAGVHQDPVVATRAVEPALLDRTAKSRFDRVARAAQSQLKVARLLRVGSPSFE